MVRYVSSRTPNSWGETELGDPQFSDSTVRVISGVLTNYEWNEPHTSEPSSYSTVLSNMDGSGTSSDPYIITNDQELQSIQGDLSAHYELGNNIDISKSGQWNGGSGFYPVGNTDAGSTAFSGSFDGAGFTVKGLTVNRSSTNRCGMFGDVDGGTIKNVFAQNIDITAAWNTGSIAARILNSSTISQCGATGSVDGGSGNNIGGITGTVSSSTLQQSYTECSVSGGEYIGGVAGYITGDITDVYATGSISGATSGGLLGDLRSTGSLTDGYWDTEASGTSTGIGTGSGDATGLTTSGMQGSSASSNMTFDFSNTWTTVSGDYPELQVLQ